ncbi:hemerythrin domain-containing protein [Streptomyces carpinensis]|uniref:Hemerythrin domain-containing protein n=1 Tax=Streptomyces carpinensis TaxID=66369 RepID=A0ABV1W668_9ACTN|nr:hemerythrin domain-containing protein [Streptomyces carpinensis]
MPSRSQVRRLLADGLDYEEAGRRLGVPPGQAFLIATGLPADGGGTLPTAEQHRPGMPQESTQHLANPPTENPTGKDETRQWLKHRAAADRQMRQAAEQRDACPEGERAPGDVHELTDVLTRDHDRVTALLKQLQALPGRKQGGTEAQRLRRQSVVDLIAEALASHEPAEQRHLWPTVRQVLDDGDRLADQALEQESQSTRTLSDLRRASPHGEEFDELAGQLGTQLRRHVAFEDAVFARLRENLAQDDRELLGSRIVQTWRTGPTRPQPHAPARPPAAVADAGAAAGLMDRISDTVGERHADRKGTERADHENPEQHEESEPRPRPEGS